MKILLCSSEVVPFAKTGGLADVAGALPLALENQKIEVAIAMPKYKNIPTEKFSIKNIGIDSIYQTKIGKNVRVYFIDNKEYFDRGSLYGTKAGDYEDNLERFSFYCKSVLDLLKKVNFKADVIHCNDWQTSLIPIYLKTIYKNDSFYKDMKTVLTIHNIGYQGLFSKDEFSKLGISDDLFSIEGLEFYDKVNFLKGGMIFSDFITTVSPTYSKEIQTKEFGAGLEGVLTKRKDSLLGIINGLDYNLWDPAKDNLIYKKYSPKSLKDKSINKRKLQNELGLDIDEDVPLFGSVGRLAAQKGLDILSEAIEIIAKSNIQMVILGTGDKKYHNLLEDVAKRFPKNVSVTLGFDNKLAHRIYAASDFFLMPSRYEPCGLGQMISMKYATIPIAYKTGGLADTIVDFGSSKSKGNGFIFDNYSSAALLETMKKAIDCYKDKRTWKKIIGNALRNNFSWDESAKKYIELYKKCISLA